MRHIQQLSRRHASNVAQIMTMSIFSLVIISVHSSTARAQWTGNGNNINNTNTGNVGVDTTSPVEKLHVNGGLVVTGPANLPNGTNGLFLGMQSPTSAEISAVQHGADFRDLNIKSKNFSVQTWNGSALLQGLFQNSAGNVGIGTTGPDTRLSVVGPGTTIPITYNVGDVATFVTPTDGPFNVAIVKGGVTNPQELSFGVNQSSHYSEIQAAHSGVTTNSLILNRQGGNVGIGTITPAYKFDVQGGQINSSGGLCIAGDCKTAWSQVGGGGSSQWTTSGSNIYYNTGNVGIGVQNPGAHAKLEVNGAGAPDYAIFSDWLNSTLRIGRSGTTLQLRTDAGQNLALMSGGKVGIGTTNPIYSLDVNGGVNGFRAKAATVSSSDTIATFENSSGIQAIVRGNGHIGIGTTNPGAKLEVVGNINVTGTGNIDASGTITGGTIVAKYQDVAEWVPSVHALPAGTVVTLDPTKSNHVEASSKAYDTRVAGVISAQPGIALGERGEDKVLVATTGRVRVIVDAIAGPIRVGDLLVTSDVAGVAMKSEPLKVGKRLMHMPGTLIGKALEPLEKGSGKILVLLSLQ